MAQQINGSVDMHMPALGISVHDQRQGLQAHKGSTGIYRRRSMRRNGITTIAASREAADNLRIIAMELYTRTPHEHARIGSKQASARVALDYLLAREKERGEEFASKIRTKDNAWIRIQKMQKKVE